MPSCSEHHTVFLMQIGGKLNSGKPHDGRAPDYDDWELNGDILHVEPHPGAGLRDLLHGHPRQTPRPWTAS